MYFALAGDVGANPAGTTASASPDPAANPLICHLPLASVVRDATIDALEMMLMTTLGIPASLPSCTPLEFASLYTVPARRMFVVFPKFFPVTLAPSWLLGIVTS